MMLSKNLVFLISALLCGLVVGERGYSSTERRRTSIGDRPSPAPVEPIENGKGKGGKSYYEIGKGVKSYKSSKSETGKGTKSGAGYYGKGYDSMSMDMELPDGKGLKDSKSSKKYDKKSKKDKKSAHGKVLLVSKSLARADVSIAQTH